MKKSMELCLARHEIPEAVDGAIYGNAIDPLNLEEMRRIVSERLAGVQTLDLYVTGLTVALVEVINYCHVNGVDLTLFHFNRDNGSYYAQKVI